MCGFELSDSQTEQFNRDGFILGPRVIERKQIGGLIGEVMRVIAERDRTDIPQSVWVRDMTGGQGDRPV